MPGSSELLRFVLGYPLRGFLKLLLLFALAGPAIGGIVMCVLVTATVVLPDLRADPDNTYGHARAADYLGTMALTMIFAFPFGLFPAIVSGISQFYMHQYSSASRLSCSVMVCIVGVAAMALEQALFFSVRSPLPLVAAAMSAVLISFAESRSWHSALQIKAD